MRLTARMWRATGLAACATMFLARGAAAQDYTYLLITDYGPGETSVHPGNPDATIRVYATLKTTDHAWAAGNLDLSADEAGWTEFDLELGSDGIFGRSRGVLTADARAVDGIISGQFNSVFGLPAQTDHPILIWSGTWSNMSSDYTPRSVALSTSGTDNYRVYVTNVSTQTQVIDQFVPGSGAITITPAPGSVAVAFLLAGLATRRRRAGPS